MLFQKAVKVGEILRYRATREIWLVVYKSTEGLFVINLMLKKNDPADVHIILPAYNHLWDRDVEIDDLEEWEKNVIESHMSLINEVEAAAQKDHKLDADNKLNDVLERLDVDIDRELTPEEQLVLLHDDDRP